MRSDGDPLLGEYRGMESGRIFKITTLLPHTLTHTLCTATWMAASYEYSRFDGIAFREWLAWAS